MVELWEKGITYFTDMGVTRGLATTYIIVSILIVLMALVALVMRIIVVIKYHKGNNMTTSSGKTSFEVAREALDKAGLKHVQVKKAGWLRAFFIGNCYSITKKTVFLRGSIANKNSITAVALALQKVGVAKMVEGKGKAAKVRNVAQILTLVGPILFVPVVLVGFLIDLLVFNALGAFSIVGIVIGLLLVFAGFVETLLNIPVEKKANEMALQMIKETHVLNAEETEVVKEVFSAYMVAYVCEFIIAVLRVVQIILEIVMNSQIANSKK
ncbi:MAG: zinc metallopeptidase [Clostridia bacterium]|nr:zinc metallopeptidase [Clostridia bacterium]